MKFKNITIAAVAALSLLALAPDSQAQERGDNTPPKTDRPKTDRPQDVEKIDKKDVNGARPITVGDKGKVPDAAKQAKIKLVETAMREEKKHREILAKITRLREVFTDKKDREQLAKLDGAEEREDARYKKLVASAKAQMGDEAFAEIAKMLESGKARVAGKIKSGKGAEGATDRKREDAEPDAKGRTTDRKREDAGDKGKGGTTDRKREDAGDKGKGGTTDRKREDAGDKGKARTNG